MVDYIPKTLTSGLLTGICPNCELLIHRVTNVATLAAVCVDLNVTRQSPGQRLTDSPDPFHNVAFAKEPQ